MSETRPCNICGESPGVKAFLDSETNIVTLEMRCLTKDRDHKLYGYHCQVRYQDMEGQGELTKAIRAHSLEGLRQNWNRYMAECAKGAK